MLEQFMITGIKKVIQWLMIVGIHKMHIKIINIKNRVYKYYFDNLNQTKLKTKDILIN